MLRPRLIPTIALRLFLLLALSFIIAISAPAFAQEATPAAIDSSDPATLTDAIAIAEPPSSLPGNDDDPVELASWEEYYGESLDGAESAWVLDGSLEFPLATLIVFSSPDNAQAGLEERREETVDFTVGGFDAWTIADRGKWICITAAGPMIVIGQALPVDIDEPEDIVRARSCEVVEATLDWLSDDVLKTSLATPSASPASDSQD